MRCFLTVLCLVLAMAVCGWAQPDSLWTHVYGTLGIEYAYSALPLADGRCVVVGSMSLPTHGSLIKIGTNGAQQWMHSLGPVNSSFNDVKQTPDGGFLMVGKTATDALLLKADSAGAEQWMQTFSHRSANFFSLTTCPNGDYIAGGVEVDSVGRSNAYFVRVDVQGNLIWERSVYGPVTPRLSLSIDVVRATPDGGCLAAGTLDTVDTVIDEDFYLLKLNSAGDTVWTRGIDGEDRQSAHSIQSTSTGYVIGGVDNRGSALYPHIIKIDDNGNVIWSRVITTLGSTGCVSAYEVESGDLLLAGTVYDGPGNPDFYVGRVMLNDSVRWMRRYGGASNEWAEDMKVTADGGCIIAGRTTSFGVSGWEAYVVRMAPVYNPNDAEPRVTVPEELSLSAYPNPFNPNATLQFDLPRAGYVRLSVFDVLGREVSELINGMTAAGPHSLTFNGATLPSGIYFARLEAAKTVQTRKLMLLK